MVLSELWEDRKQPVRSETRIDCRVFEMWSLLKKVGECVIESMQAQRERLKENDEKRKQEYSS